MDHPSRLLTLSMTCWAIVVGLLAFTGITAHAIGVETQTVTQTEELTSAVDTNKNYSGLSDLITTVCDEALGRFQDFYEPSVIIVEPFTTIGFYEKNKQSELGVTLADQITAVMNNGTLKTKGRASGETTQKMNGVLQEVDGYLRIHLNGINADGEKASYVISVEMSAPIYRALHTYL
jgi:hypothetical protein